MAKKPQKKTAKKKQTDAKRSDPVETQTLMARRSFRTEIRKHIFAFSFLCLGLMTAVAGGAGLYAALLAIDVSHTLRLQGRLQAIEQSTPVQHDVGGVVKDVFVTDGEIVREGQILMALGTEDLEADHRTAQQAVARMLIRSACLNALIAKDKKFAVSSKLQEAIGRLDQVEFMRRAVRNCQTELHQRRLDDLAAAEELTNLSDQAELHQRLTNASQMLQRRRLSLPDLPDELPKDVQEVLAKDRLQQVLEHALAASRAKEALSRARFRIERQKSQQLATLERESDLIADQLINARAELTKLEQQKNKRFVFANASGRIQRLRLKEPGKRLAAGAYVMEIAPLTTDFEVLSTVSLAEIPDLEVGKAVQVRLSGASNRDVWVPAEIEEIVKSTLNKRLVRIRLKREDLNKRDLLWGDYTLNGLGEQSEALISVKSETAINSLRSILRRQFFESTDQET